MDKITLIQSGLYFCELMACVTGFIYWKKIKNTYWRWFPIYLTTVVIVEISGKLIHVSGNTELNTQLYRYFGIPIQFLFFFWLFQRYFSVAKENRWPLFGTSIYILSWIIEMFFFEKVKTMWFMSFSYTIGNIVLLVFIIIFFIRFVNSEAILKYKQSIMFWVCLGLLVFYLGTFPFYALRNTLLKPENRPIFDVYFYVSFGLDYLMYIFFTIAFIWGRPK